MLEAYLLGQSTVEEQEMVTAMAALFPEVAEEMNKIELALENYALEHAVSADSSTRAMVMASVDYVQRCKAGEPMQVVPHLSTDSVIADYTQWLHAPDMQPQEDFDNLFIKIIHATPEVTTALIWVKQYTSPETHHEELERFFILEGTCTIYYGDNHTHLKAGDFFPVPLHQSHVVKVTSPICKAIVQRTAIAM